MTCPSKASSLGLLYGATCLLLLFPLMSCKGKGGGAIPDLPSAGEETRFSVLITPERKLDLLFMVDNSSSMDPKQESLVKAFPKLIETLQKLPGGLPDLHVGVVSSDMGAGYGEAGGDCSVVLGNQGILWGNDPTVSTDKNNKLATVKEISNSAGASGCGMNSGTRWIEDVLKADGLSRSKNYQGDLTDVFACLAKAVGVNGCGYEHPLQSLRVALNPIVRDGYDASTTDINPQNVGFQRQKAYLGIVLVSDEDDCSADPDSRTNDNMFVPRNLGDSASLRCAARGHVCNGNDIPDYDANAGYTNKDPFVAKFSECEAKDIERQPRNDTDPTYAKLPLIRIRDLVDSVNQVKDRPSEQILASGIIGWPQDGKLDGVEYRIDKDTTAVPEPQQKLWDYMPICTIENRKSADGNPYKAYGGLRLKKFLDAFKREDDGNVFSVCQPDFEDAMRRVGKALGRRLNPGCIDFPLADSDSNVPGIQPECIVKQKISCDHPGTSNCLYSGYVETEIPQCRDGQGNLLDQESPRTDTVSADSRPCWYVWQDHGDFSCTKEPWSLRPILLSRGDAVVPLGSLLEMSCMTCPEGQAGCEL